VLYRICLLVLHVFVFSFRHKPCVAPAVRLWSVYPLRGVL
jgi:hypothetical protein